MRIFPLFLVVLISGCAPASLVKPIDSTQRAWLLSGVPLTGDREQTPALPDDKVFALTGEMKHFAREAVRGRPDDESRLNRLVQSLLSPGGLGLKYDGTATYTAEGVFDHHLANCLSFTTLFVPMARYLGFNVRYLEVQTPAIWDLQSRDTMVLYKHVDAMVRLTTGHAKVIDINMEDFDVTYPHRMIPDDLAEAQYYNNRAMKFLGDGKYVEALRYQLKALTLYPKASFLWSNLASLYKRSGNNRAAELGYRQALAVDSSDLVATSNLARLYEALGRKKLAQALRSRAERFRSRNPYYQYLLAVRALGDHNYDGAEKYARKAIHLYSKEHRFYFLLGVIYEQEGEHIKANRSWQEAIKLATSQAQVSRYRHKIEMLSSMNS